MVVSEIKLVRLPVDVKCEDCSRILGFGSWAHFESISKRAICLECGAKRGWSDKDRALNLIKKRELQEDIKALRKRQKVESNLLYTLKEEVDVCQFGKRYLDLEKQIHALIDTVQSYFGKVATAEEKKILQQVFNSIRSTQELQKVIQEELESRLFLLERSKRRKQIVPKVIDDDADDLPEQEMVQ